MKGSDYADEYLSAEGLRDYSEKHGEDLCAAYAGLEAESPYQS